MGSLETRGLTRLSQEGVVPEGRLSERVDNDGVVGGLADELYGKKMPSFFCYSASASRARVAFGDFDDKIKVA